MKTGLTRWEMIGPNSPVKSWHCVPGIWHSLRIGRGRVIEHFPARIWETWQNKQKQTCNITEELPWVCQHAFLLFRCSRISLIKVAWNILQDSCLLYATSVNNLNFMTICLTNYVKDLNTHCLWDPLSWVNQMPSLSPTRIFRSTIPYMDLGTGFPEQLLRLKGTSRLDHLLCPWKHTSDWFNETCSCECISYLSVT